MELHKKSEIYNLISGLSLQLLKDGNIYSRADVAFELKKLGVEGDSLQIETFIKETYNVSNKEVKEAIKRVFLDNRLLHPIIEENSIKTFIEENKLGKALSILEKDSSEINELLVAFVEDSSKLLDFAIKYVEKKQLAGYITGSVQVSNVKKEAELLYADYQKFIDNYAQTKIRIIELIDNFSLLRSSILGLYREKVSILTDVFGETIKTIAPKLFDFTTIEWLDTVSMIKNIELEYENLINTCSTIVCEIQKEFIGNFSNSLRLLGKGGGSNSLTLAMVGVGFNILNSWAESSKQATILKQELEKMKQKMVYDANLINADITRLQLIDRTLRNIYIPTAHVFEQNFNTVFSKELDSLLEILYRIPQVKEIRNEKDKLLAQFHSLESDIIDHQAQITLYESNINSEEKQIKEYNPLYLEAKSKKPKKPFILINKTRYNRDVAEWHQEYLPIIEAFVEAREQLKIDKEELSNHRKAIEEKKKYILAINRNIDIKSREINSYIKTDPSLQTKIAKHLAPMVNMLRIAKKIVEFKVDEKYLKAVKLEIPEHIQILPKEIDNQVKEVLSDIKVGFAEEFDKEKLVGDTPAAIGVGTEMIGLFNTVVDVTEQVYVLKKMQIQGRIQQEYYEKELARLQDEFEDSFGKIEDKNTMILELSKKITFDNGESVKETLLLLDNHKNMISETEIIQALRGNNYITL